MFQEWRAFFKQFTNQIVYIVDFLAVRWLHENWSNSPFLSVILNFHNNLYQAQGNSLSSYVKWQIIQNEIIEIKMHHFWSLQLKVQTKKTPTLLKIYINLQFEENLK